VRSRPATTLRPAPAALPRPVPTAPLDHPIGGWHFHEASARVHAIHPSPRNRLAASPEPGTPAGPRRSSPRPPPPDGTRPASAFTPGFAPRSYPRRTPERRQALAHWPGYYTLDISRTSKRCLPLDSSTLTSHVVRCGLHRHHLHTCRRQLPFGPGIRPYPTSYAQTTRRRVPVLRPAVSCCLSAIGIGFLGHPAPAGELSLPHGRPTGPRNWPDPNGVVVLHMSKLRPGRVPPLSRGRWCAPGRRLSSGRHLPLSCGQSLRPR